MADDKQQEDSDLEQEEKEVDETMKKLEEDPPEKLEDWPDGRAKYETFGGAEGGDHSYDEGPEAKLGPSSLERHEDGSITIEGEPVENPEEYKTDSILEEGKADPHSGTGAAPSDQKKEPSDQKKD